MNSFCEKRGIVQDVLLEFNLSGEESKYGFNNSMLDKLMNVIPSLTNLRIKGLMTMAPFTQDCGMISCVFSSLRNISESLLSVNMPNYKGLLSMGMSNDYKVAVKEGSNIIRIGTKIFEKQ